MFHQKKEWHHQILERTAPQTGMENDSRVRICWENWASPPRPSELQGVHPTNKKKLFLAAGKFIPVPFSQQKCSHALLSSKDIFQGTDSTHHPLCFRHRTGA